MLLKMYVVFKCNKCGEMGMSERSYLGKWEEIEKMKGDLWNECYKKDCEGGLFIVGIGIERGRMEWVVEERISIWEKEGL